MKSNKKKRVLAAVLCMVMVLSSNISALAGEEIFVDAPADAVELSSEPAEVFEAEPEVIVDDVTGGEPAPSQTEPTEPAPTETEVTESPAADQTQSAPAETTEDPAAADVFFSDGSEPTPVSETEPQNTADTPVTTTDAASAPEPTTDAAPTPETTPATGETPEQTGDFTADGESVPDLGDGAEMNENISAATELKQEFVDGEGNVVQRVTANLPEGAFAAAASDITMEVNYLDADSENHIKAMMNEQLPEGMQLGTYVFFDIQFKVKGEKAEALQPITITIEGSNLKITDTKKANVFYFDRAEAEGEQDKLQEIAQRSEVLESLQAAGQSTENIEDYDLSEITFREDGSTDKIIFEGRKSTIYGCYVEEEKPAEETETPETPEGSETPETPEIETPETEVPEAGSEETTEIEILLDEVNLRTEPNAEADNVAAMAYAGDRFTLIETVTVGEEIWYKIQYVNPETGEASELYVRNDCAQIVEENIEVTDDEDVEITDTSDDPEVITRYDYKSEDVNVLVTLTDPADLPDNAELSVTPVTISETAEEQIEEEAIKEKKSIENIVAYDIKFLVDGEEIQPGATVNVQVSVPTIEAGQDAAVYHVDEDDVVENMDGSVNEEGNVTFDTPHFSIYVIVQQGENEVEVTIEHYDYSNKWDPVEIYQKDVLTLPVGGKINNYAKAVNWDVAKVVEVTDNGSEKDVSTDEEIKVSSDKTFRVYYTPKETTTQGAVSFYDYTARAGSVTKESWFGSKTTYYSINMPENYERGAISQDKLSAGGAENDRPDYTYNYPEYQHYTLIKDGNGREREANKWLGANTNKPEQMLKGMVNGLDSEGNVVFNYAQPGFFKDSDLTFELGGETRYLRKVYKDYKLEFTQSGDTYQLSKVYDGRGNNVASAGGGFWPLNSVRPRYTGYADTNNIPDKEKTNPFFGMRYDVRFKIGDYVGPLNYSFTGDDDFWVILDGKEVVIDLGGIHNACTDEVDLWDYLLDHGQSVDDLTDVQKAQEHTLTILYMERGAGEANCNMNFTLPSAQISEVTKVPMADLVIKKVNKAGDALEGARFSLSDSNGKTVAMAISTKDGTVMFSKLREGTYTLKEDMAPSGYIPSVDTWIVKVEVNADGAAVATMYLSDGKTEYTDKTGSVYEILNVTKQELIDSAMDYNKTAHVKDWDKRTYDINITASSKLTETTSIEKDAVADMMLVFDTSGSMLPAYGDYRSDEWGLRAVGRYSSKKNDLDTTKLYYYGKETIDVKYQSGWTTHTYGNATHPMIYIEGQWQYYDDDGRWRSVTSDDRTYIYTINSNLNALKEAATTFVNSAAVSSPQSRIGMATFNSANSANVVQRGLADLSNDSAMQMVKTINSLRASAGTSPQIGLEYAQQQLLANEREDIPQYVILFTDGAPSTDDDKTATETKAEKLRQEGIVVYTVGLGLTDTTAEWLDTKIASEGCDFTANNADELKEIFNKIKDTITQNLDIKSAQIRDVVDPRFVIQDDQGNPITESYPGIEEGITLANGGKVTYFTDEDGNKYQQIVWTEQTIPHNKDGQWNKTFTVAAKEEYIGGNNVTTNISPDSAITTGYGDAVLPQPVVNVKSDLVVKDKEVTIYYGDKVPTEEAILNTLFDKNNPTGNITLTDGTTKTVTYTMGTDGKPINPDNFTLTWYEDEECTTSITPEEMKDVVPEPAEKKYYLKVSYNALGQPTDKSNVNTNNNIASGEAHHETKAEQEYGTYTIHVVSGEIRIIKTLDKPSDKDETFEFTINRVDESNGQETEKPVATVTVTVKAGEETASYTYAPAEGEASGTDPLNGLKRGKYVVREKDSDSFDVQQVVVTDSTDCFAEPDTEKVTFVLGNNKDDKNVISSEYTHDGTGVLGEVSFTNEKIMKNWEIIKTSTSSPDNSIVLPGAEFKLTPKSENAVQKIYVGISGTDGVVEWYETDDHGNKTDEKVTKFEPGFYELTETKAPSGYLKSDATWTVRLSAKGYLISVEGEGLEKPEISVENGKTVYKFYFKNTPVYDLPSSGGSGIFGYMIGGVAMMMAAMFILYKMRRKGVLRS